MPEADGLSMLFGIGVVAPLYFLSSANLAMMTKGNKMNLSDSLMFAIPALGVGYWTFRTGMNNGGAWWIPFAAWTAPGVYMLANF